MTDPEERENMNWFSRGLHETLGIPARVLPAIKPVGNFLGGLFGGGKTAPAVPPSSAPPAASNEVASNQNDFNFGGGYSGDQHREAFSGTPYVNAASFGQGNQPNPARGPTGIA